MIRYMKTFIITSKDSDQCQERIIDNWFDACSFLEIHTDSSIVSTELQPEYNTVRVKEDGNYRICLTSCVKPYLPQDTKVNYVLSLITLLIKELAVQKSDVFLFIHAGDLFDQKDSRRITGHVRFSWLNCSSDILNKFQDSVEEDHFYQFRHNGNDVSDILLEPDDEELSSLCETLLDII